MRGKTVYKQTFNAMLDALGELREIQPFADRDRPGSAI